jgi:hypothetical protein
MEEAADKGGHGIGSGDVGGSSGTEIVEVGVEDEDMSRVAGSWDGVEESPSGRPLLLASLSPASAASSKEGLLRRVCRCTTYSPTVVVGVL